jgi:hypothetical protein
MYNRNLTLILLITMILSCEQDHIFKHFEKDKVVFIGLAKYGLDSIPPEINQLKAVEELTISLDSTAGWTIYPPFTAMTKMVDQPPYKKIPDELTELKSLKKLNISGLNIRTLPENFTELKNLEYLNLSMNKLDLKNELSKLRSLPNLKVLSISGNKIDSTQIEKWKNDNPKIDIQL